VAERHARDRPPEHQHPGAQLRLTDAGGHRLTAFTPRMEKLVKSLEI
jgi:hypothetical protein